MKNQEDSFGVKDISVVFATIGGFEVPSTAGMDAIEAVSSGKDQLNGELDRITRKYGGVIDKIIRSFFMATFGTKDTREADPVYAVLAAMEMLEAIENFQGALRFRVGTAYQFDLDKETISEELRREFQTNETPLSADAVVSIKEKGSKWLIADKTSDQTYALEKADDQLNVYNGAKIHIGINSGPAWVGELGVKKEYTQTTVIGNTVNLSARLKGKAGLNQIVVSPASYELTKDFFVYEALAPVDLKGITEPVPIFAVTDKTREAEQVIREIEQIIVEKADEEETERAPEIENIEKVPPYLQEKIDAARRTIEGERKIVTMLYSDLSGFTALSEKFQEEPWKIAKLMDECHDALGEVIYAHEGIVDQIVGDELMAMFGVPIQHEDNPQRAVEAGLEMLEEIKRFSERKAVEMGCPPLDVHIGVNTGRIAIGNIGTDATTKVDYTAIGEPVELAETLEELSDTGELLVGERTYRLTRALFDYEKKTDVEVGGNLVGVYKVLSKKEAPELLRGVTALNKVFVARDQEFNTLKSAASHLLNEGRGHFVCAIGQAGLGKSRLKREFKSELGDQVSWLEGTCFGHTEQTAYSVFISAIKAYLDIEEHDSDEEVSEKLISKVKNLFRKADTDLSEEIIPYIGNQLLSLRFEGERADKVRYLDAEGRRQRTFAAIKDLLVAESKRRPVVLALDDLHWVDPVSLELIFFLMETIIDEQILLLCLYRPEREDPCWKIGEQAESRIPADFTQIVLDPLSPKASEELLEGLLTLEGAEELKAQILEKSDGNPFYMEEVLRSLIDDQVIVKVNPDDPNNSRWEVKRELTESGPINIPDNLELMMEARIDRMDDDPKAVLQRGAVIGRTFESDLIQEISQVPGELEAHLSQLTVRDMIKLQMPPTDPLEYIFGHIVTYEIAYNTLPLGERRSLHTQIAACMEAKHQEHLERTYEQLAQHYHNGNDAGKAVTYLVKAGTKAKRQFNSKVALTFYQQGLEHLKELDEDLPAERLEIHEGLGDVNTILGELDGAIANYKESLQISRDTVHRASLKRKMADVHEKRAEFDLGMKILEEALGDLKNRQQPEEEARIYNAIGSIHSKRKANFAQAIEMTKRALELVEGTKAYDILAAIDKNLGTYSLRTADVDRGKEYYLKAIELADQIGDKMLMAQVYNNLGVIGQMTGQMDAALENFQKCLQSYEQLGYALGMATTYTNLITIYSRLGEVNLALECYEKAITIGQRTGAQKIVAQAESYIGSLYWRQDDYDQAAEHYLESLEIRRTIKDAEGEAECCINLVEAFLGQDDLEAAEIYALMGLGTAYLINVPMAKAAAHNSLGLVEKRKSAWDFAMGYFEEAARFAESAGARLQLADAYRYIGEVSIELKDREGAKEFCQKALELFEQLKSSKNVEETRALLQKCDA